MVLLCVNALLYGRLLSTPPGHTGDNLGRSSSDFAISQGKGPAGSDAWCSYCDNEIPVRAHHCHQCKKCVLTFDHHCGWVGQCIGQRNHRPFVAFVAVQSLVAARAFDCGLDVRNGLSGLGNPVLASSSAYAAALAAALAATFLFCVFLCGLLAFHVYLVITAQASQTRHVECLRFHSFRVNHRTRMRRQPTRC